MVKIELVTMFVVFVLANTIWYSSSGLYAQSQPTTGSLSKVTPVSGNARVSVSSSISIPVSNETIKTNEATLKSAVVGLLNSGPNILKTSDNYQLNVKTKITNQMNNTTQNVEGIEATNAIVGVEIGKGLRNVISSTAQQNHTSLITVTTSSACNPAANSVVSCNNTVLIK
jgi:hypothetical protein